MRMRRTCWRFTTPAQVQAASPSAERWTLLADPYAGTVAPNGKEIWSVQEAADNLHRNGTDWTHGNYGALDDGVLTYGFWTYDQFLASYFYDLRYSDGEAYNDDAFYAETYGLFEAFRADQQSCRGRRDRRLGRPRQRDVPADSAGTEADIMFGAVFMGAAAGAHAYYPQAEALDGYYGTTGYGKTSGDVMINWYYNSPNGDPDNPVLPRGPDDSFSNFSFGSYGNLAITHELGHSLGLSHGGQYNATAGPATYAHEGIFLPGQQPVHDHVLLHRATWPGKASSTWTLSRSTIPDAGCSRHLTIQSKSTAPMHDDASGDTVYGFNSTADKGVYDLRQNPNPYLTV